MGASLNCERFAYHTELEKYSNFLSISSSLRHDDGMALLCVQVIKNDLADRLIIDV